MNDVLELLNKRKSLRVFSDKHIDKETKELIFNAISQAPSAGNQQMFSIIDITDQDKKDKLSILCDNQPFIKKADMVLVFVADHQKWFDAYKEAGISPRPLGVGDLAIAITDTCIAAQNGVIAAESLGIGSCYIGDIMENYEKMVELLNLPKYVFPCCMLVFGYPAEGQENRQKPKRHELKDLVMENEYKLKSGEELREMFKNKLRDKTYEEWFNMFYKFKYDSDFSKEMTRSVEKYIDNFKK